MYASTGKRVLGDLFYYISVKVGEVGVASTQEGITHPYKPVGMWGSGCHMLVWVHGESQRRDFGCLGAGQGRETGTLFGNAESSALPPFTGAHGHWSCQPETHLLLSHFMLSYVIPAFNCKGWVWLFKIAWDYTESTGAAIALWCETFI